MPKAFKSAMQEIKTRPLDWTLRLVTIIILGLGTYITIRLVPIYQNLNLLDFRVSAIEERNQKTDPLIDRFLQLEERDKALIEDVREIRENIRDIKNFLNIR